MAYEQPTAAPRDKNVTNTTDGDWKRRKKDSRQEQFTGTNDGRRVVKPDTRSVTGGRFRDPQRELPEYLKVGPNTQDTSELKNPLQSYQRRVYPATKNPDPVKDRTGNNKAPRRNLGRPSL